MTIILDKTGTITHGTSVLTDVLVTGVVLEEELLRLVRAVEKSSKHPLAGAIVEGAVARGLAMPGVETRALRGRSARSSGRASATLAAQDLKLPS